MTANQIIAHYKTATKAASVIGVHRQAFAYWRKNGVPTYIQKQVELQTGGKLKAKR